MRSRPSSPERHPAGEIGSLLTAICATLISAAVAAPAAGQDRAAGSAAAAPRPELHATRLDRSPVIDGVLNDDVWQGVQPLQTSDWRSYNPLHGDAIPQQTTVWAAYDSDNLYFAFKCDDPDPSGIKTSVTRRDNIWADDWVGLSLDRCRTT